MANALDPPTIHPILNAHPSLRLEIGGYQYSIQNANGASTYSVSNGEQTLSLPIRWAFGAHSQTWVLAYEGKMYESRVSFYESMGGLALTMGDLRLNTPQTIVEAMGREISPTEAKRCFQCHSTGALSGGEINLESLTPGVRCEHCHAHTEEHFEAISKGKLTSLPAKLKQMTSEDIANFCGQCHRSFSDVVRDRLFGPMNVRFQPYRLAQSKCFNGSDARISCVACHDPHRPLVKADTPYEVKCLACHAKDARSRPADAEVCSTGAVTRCITCHMPKIQLPGGHQTFTDHYIRLVRAGEKYPE